MINNRQNGRRRGRGGPQVRGPGGADRGNRIDNRARGNAAQLHEKYKNLARDAQTQGDRVLTEYYLQFADHYFRVLNETRARFEEQNPQRRPRQDFDEDDGQDEGEERDEQPHFHPQPQSQPQRRERQPMREPAGAQQAMPEAGADPREAGAGEDGDRPRRGRRPRVPRAEMADEGERIDASSLPPSVSLGVEGEANGRANGHAAADEDGEPAPRRRRLRKASAEDGSTVAA